MAERSEVPEKQNRTRRLFLSASHPGSTKIIIPASLTLLPAFEAAQEGAEWHWQEGQCKNRGCV